MRLGDGERGSAEDDGLRALPVPPDRATFVCPCLSRESILRCFLGGDLDLDLLLSFELARLFLLGGGDRDLDTEALDADLERLTDLPRALPPPLGT